jgi:hypothetical protein
MSNNTDFRSAQPLEGKAKFRTWSGAEMTLKKQKQYEQQKQIGRRKSNATRCISTRKTRGRFYFH